MQKQVAGDNGTTVFHPVGACKIGPVGDPAAVVDHTLRLHGIDGLRVIDASIMPASTFCNINGPTLMIAEPGADLVRAALRVRS